MPSPQRESWEYYTPPNAYPEQKLTVAVTYQGKKIEGEDYFTIICAWDA